jgi:hypothetical protein
LFVGSSKVGDALTKSLSFFGFALEVCEATALFGEEGRRFSELGVCLINEGLFCLEFGSES